MARPQTNNADYFPHYNSMRNHRKVKMLRNKFGSVLGYAFWSMMLEWLTEHDGLEWDYSEIEIEMFASELGVSAAEIPPMVDYCIRVCLLTKTDSGFVFSESLNDTLQPVFIKRSREREKSKDRKRKENGTFISLKTTSRGVSAAEIPQSRVEYSKEEYISGVETPPIDFGKFISFFNSFANRSFKISDKVKKALNARLKDYTKIQVQQAVTNAHLDQYHIDTNFKYLTPEFILRPDKLDKFLNAPTTTQTINYNPYTRGAAN